jgi:hypothetical protein
MDEGGRATSGTVAEKVGMRELKSITYNHLPEGEGIFKDSLIFKHSLDLPNIAVC